MQVLRSCSITEPRWRKIWGVLVQNDLRMFFKVLCRRTLVFQGSCFVPSHVPGQYFSQFLCPTHPQKAPGGINRWSPLEDPSSGHETLEHTLLQKSSVKIWATWRRFAVKIEQRASLAVTWKESSSKMEPTDCSRSFYIDDQSRIPCGREGWYYEKGKQPRWYQVTC